MPIKWSKLYNPIMRALLHSPLHGPISRHFMTITFTGRKSGRVYTVPVEYFYDGDTLMCFTSRDRVWWKNLRGGAPITAHVRGRELQGTAEAITGDVAAFEAALRAYLRKYPGRAKYFDVRMDADGGPNPEDVARAAAAKVVVRIDMAQD